MKLTTILTLMAVCLLLTGLSIPASGHGLHVADLEATFDDDKHPPELCNSSRTWSGAVILFKPIDRPCYILDVTNLNPVHVIDVEPCTCKEAREVFKTLSK
jgi:hypothetical protein